MDPRVAPYSSLPPHGRPSSHRPSGLAHHPGVKARGHLDVRHGVSRSKCCGRRPRSRLPILPTPRPRTANVLHLRSKARDCGRSLFSGHLGALLSMGESTELSKRCTGSENSPLRRPNNRTFRRSSGSSSRAAYGAYSIRINLDCVSCSRSAPVRVMTTSSSNPMCISPTSA